MSIDGRCRRCAHINAAGAAQILHTADPDKPDIFLPAQLRNWSRHGRVGVFCQENDARFPLLEGLAQLLVSHNDMVPGQILQIAALMYFTYFLHIHTR